MCNKTMSIVQLCSAAIALAVGTMANNCLYGTAQESQNVSALGDWGYAVDNGPLYWSRLSPSNSLCSTGTSQSPIDIGNLTVLRQADVANERKFQ
jgi:carbonic anhydrase